MYSHLSQDPDGTYKNYFKPLEEFRGLECGVKAAEAFIHFKDKAEQGNHYGVDWLTVDSWQLAVGSWRLVGLPRRFAYSLFRLMTGFVSAAFKD